MTVPNFPRVRNPRRTRLVAAAVAIGVAASALMVVVVVRIASERPGNLKLGQERFEVGRADVFARAIRRDGPILFKDPLSSGPGREIYVQHLGDELRKGWLALDAYARGAPREQRCIVEWDPDGRIFTDPCGGAEIGADGTGARTYPGEVDDRGAVIIDLRTR